uniref:Uncharacterized protein n=1 Tax=Mesocestoides corti TaxID=53468 RepID=A0A5K3EMM0_MESCO
MKRHTESMTRMDRRQRRNQCNNGHPFEQKGLTAKPIELININSHHEKGTGKHQFGKTQFGKCLFRRTSWHLVFM